ncbi:MAG: hypothetical protein ACKO6Q_08090 [Bacteroidota bacterium]
MQKILTACLIVLAFACNNQPPKPRSENDLDAARNFIEAALANDFKKASQFMLDDSLNRYYLDMTARTFDHMDAGTKEKYRGASIRIHQPVSYLNDSTTIVIYSNSYKNDRDTLRIRRRNDNWQVDLKYLFEHDQDTLQKIK